MLGSNGLAPDQASQADSGLIRDTKRTPDVVARAILIVGNYGGVQDLPLIDPFRTDRREWTWYRKYQLREAATTMALHLQKQDVERFGFDKLNWVSWWVGDTPIPFVSTGSFDKAADRDAAVAKAGKWLDERSKSDAAKK